MCQKIMRARMVGLPDNLYLTSLICRYCYGISLHWTWHLDVFTLVHYHLNLDNFLSFPFPTADVKPTNLSTSHTFLTPSGAFPITNEVGGTEGRFSHQKLSHHHQQQPNPYMWLEAFGGVATLLTYFWHPLSRGREAKMFRTKKISPLKDVFHQWRI